MNKWPLYLSYAMYDKYEKFVGSMEITLLFDDEKTMRRTNQDYVSQIGCDPGMPLTQNILVSAFPGMSPYPEEDDFPIT